MTGLKPAVIGLIGTAVLSIGKTVFFENGVTAEVLKNKSFYISLVIFALAMLLTVKKKHPILIICVSAVLGIAAGYLL